MNAQTPYSIHTDVKFKPLELIDVQRLRQETKDQWFPFSHLDDRGKRRRSHGGLTSAPDA
jgi:hypothetical protein